MLKEPKWKLESLAIADIRLDDRFQMRVAGTDLKHVQRLIGELTILKDGEALEPVKIGRIGKAHYLLDGFHRIEAHVQTGRSHVMAKIAKMSEPEAREYAASANLKHGKGPSRADKQAAFTSYIEAGRHIYGAGAALEGCPKKSDVISAELGGIYTPRHLRTMLKKLGLLDEATEFPQGYKAFYSESGAEELEAEREEEATDTLWRFEALYQTVEEEAQLELLQTARDILEALENGRRPTRPAEVVMDI